MHIQRFPSNLSCEKFYDDIAEALAGPGWIVIPEFLETADYLPLMARAAALGDEFKPAGIGRGDGLHEDDAIRSDAIFWLEDESPQDRLWLEAMESLRLALNRRLFLGLFEYESHYACYHRGDFYLRHLDAFRGQGNRIVTTVLYLNTEWRPCDGGELVIYPAEGEHYEGLPFLPKGGTLAVFLSEELPHEVLKSHRTRYSIAGWFRLNTTTGDNLDPPK